MTEHYNVKRTTIKFHSFSLYDSLFLSLNLLWDRCTESHLEQYTDTYTYIYVFYISVPECQNSLSFTLQYMVNHCNALSKLCLGLHVNDLGQKNMNCLIWLLRVREKPSTIIFSKSYTHEEAIYLRPYVYIIILVTGNILTFEHIQRSDTSSDGKCLKMAPVGHE